MTQIVYYSPIWFSKKQNRNW